MSEQPRIQDDITIQLQVQKTVTHENVRISVSVQAQVDPEQTDADFRKEIHRTLRKFVPGEWKIQNISRQKGNQFETVWVNAVVRASDKEDYQLESRAAKVSRIGFELVNPRAEYELTFDEVQAVNQELRLMLLTQALAECKAINQAIKESGFTGQKYRISSSRFDGGMQAGGNNNRRNFANAPMIAASMAASALPLPSGQYNVSMNDVVASSSEDDASGTDEGSDDIGVSSRFSMTGVFVLRSLYA